MTKPLTDYEIINRTMSRELATPLTDSQKMLIEQRISNEKPSEAVAYLLCIFVGLLGAHRFYLGHIASGVAMLILTLTFVGIFISAIWNIVDLFLIKSMINDKTTALRTKITAEITN